MDLSITTITETKTKDLKPVTDYLKNYFSNLGDGTSRFLGIETGMTSLDEATYGLDGLMVLGGLPGAGKTTLALQLAYQILQRGIPVLYYSMEMSTDAILTKIFSRLSGVEYKSIVLKGAQINEKMDESFGNSSDRELLSPTEKEELLKAIEEFKKISEKLYIRTNDWGQQEISFDTLEADIKTVKERHNSEKIFVVVDHFQIFPIGDYQDQLDKENKLITRFKLIVENTSSAILLISQLNKDRSNEYNQARIKGSVNIVYLADMVMMLIDSQGSVEVKNKYRKLKLKIEKSRYSGQAEIDLLFDGRYSIFKEKKVLT